MLLWEPYVSYLLNKNNNFSIIYSFDIESDKYVSNVMIKNNNKFNLNESVLSLFIDLIKNTIDSINNYDENILNVLSSIFNLEREIIKNSLKRVNFNYKKWEE
mgnify:CR=1 FL=1